MSIKLNCDIAKQNKVLIGAHPSYEDLIGFGRRSMNYSNEEIKAIILYQIGALSAFCKIHNTKISYVKPHGALYNDMMKDKNIYKAILGAISSYDKNIKLMILSTMKNKEFENIAKEFKVSLLYEVFADRNYNDDGTLLARSHKDAIIYDKKKVAKRLKTLKEKGFLKSINDKKLYIKAHSICVHGDNEKALEFIKIIKKALT